MMRILKVGGVTLATLLGAILLLAGTMWLSPDVRYRVAYYLVEHFDLNSPVSTAELNRQMAALQSRVGKNELRIVLYSNPRDWEKDKRTAKELGLNFELISAKNASAADLNAIDLGVMPNSTFARANGESLMAVRAPRPWDSAQWEAIIRHWYAGGR